MPGARPPDSAAPATPRPIQAFLSNQAASATRSETIARGAPSQASAPAGSSSQTVPAGLNGLVPLLSALREPRLVRALVAGWLATQHNPPTQPNPLAGVGGAIAPGGTGLTETPLGAVLQQAARHLRARPELAARDPATRQATLDFMQRLGEQVERSQISTALSQGAAGQAAGTQAGPNQPVWLLEIPLQLANQAHNLRMAIREEDQGPNGDGREARWQLDLAMDWPQLGPVHAALVLRGTRIDVDLFADRPGTVSILEASRTTLARGLEEAGLTPGRLGAYEGPPPASVSSRLEPDTASDDTPSAHGFLSEQA
ncbi:flagellar hook-length control protein FliK [Guyparkeria hydrothermalis]|uniref:flagellar hook-length control protein FliK n=1 Tax=Guyparkeria hydrothermalis TaxID=923 RepID=UPI00202057BC|nr:flagellar hook-length control protein FliK [Guyparkeria hydrothermalis]MCL7744532.1 flagellar hook-length control protein FliK [Guyparkeria hydrothermalis]